MDAGAKKLELFEALLGHGGLARLAEVAARVMGNPVIVADMGLNVIAVGGDTAPLSSGEEGSDELEALRAAFRDVVRHGDFKRVYETDEAVLGSYPSSPYEFLASRVRVGQSVVGHVAVVASSREIIEEDREVLPAAAQAVGFELSARGFTAHRVQRYEPLFVELIDGGELSAQAVRERLRQAGARVSEPLRVVVVEPVGAEGRISAHYLREQLLRAFPGSIGIELGERNVHAIDGSLPREDVERRLTERVSLEGSACGVSEPVAELSRLRVGYEQARAAVRLSGRDEGADAAAGGGAGGSVTSAALAFHEDVFCRHLRERACADSDPALFSTPMLDVLRACDRRDGTDRVCDLAAYLFSGRNIARAAEALSIHKNSMYYRLSRIEELTGADLHDEQTCFRLELALAMEGDVE